ncbi:MAG: hypothetical protein QXZ44_02165 [Ferroplasma sp.]
MKVYPEFISGTGMILIVSKNESPDNADKPPAKEILATEFFSQNELDIIDLLMRNNYAML